MKSLNGVLNGGLWIRFNGLPEFLSYLPPKDGPDANFGRPCFKKNKIQQDIFQDNFHGRFIIDSIIDSMTYKCSQIGRVETYYIKPNPPLFPPTKYVAIQANVGLSCF